MRWPTAESELLSGISMRTMAMAPKRLSSVTIESGSRLFISTLVSRRPGQSREALESLVEFDPSIVLVSAGFDAYVGDPLTEMSLGRDDFAAFGRWLRETGLPAAPILEGGYSDDLPVLIEAFLTAWSD